MPKGPGTYGSKKGRPPKKKIYKQGGTVKKYNKGGSVNQRKYNKGGSVKKTKKG